MNGNTITIEQVVEDSNLLQAWYKVRANQGCAGVDHVTISAFEQRLFSRLSLLRDEVHYKTYRPLPLLRVYIPKKSGGKRALSIPVVRDRVLHTAVALVLTPVFEKEFEECSYAYREGRSVDMAVRRIVRLRDEGFVWVVDADIHSYFDEIDHNQLLTEAGELVDDPDILHLLRLWLDCEVQDGNRRFVMKKGVSQGSPLAPLLANLYLDRFDETMLDSDFRLVRFSDDFIVLCKNRKQAEKALELTGEALDALKLRINEAKTHLVDFNHGFRFLGVDFVRSLVMKTRYPDLKPRVFDAGSLAEIPARIEDESSETGDHGASQPRTAMDMAIEEAGINKRDFPVDVGQDTESDLLQTQDDARPEAEHDPLLRTLYIMAPGLVLGKESQRFVIRKKGRVIKKIPAIKVDQIMIFGNAQVTTQAMRFCIREKIPVFLLSGKGRYYGVIDGFDTDPVLLHRDQFRCADTPEFCLNIARRFIRGKIANCRVVLLRLKRRRVSQSLGRTAGALKEIMTRLDTAGNLDELRGMEGNGARIYFAALSDMIDEDWQFSKRTRQPPKDPVNSMLSYGYTLLFYNLYSLLRTRGMNPHVGFLHPVRQGHPALVSDIIEEFRAIVVDVVVLNLVMNRRVIPDQFSLPSKDGEACLLNDRARRLFVKELERKFNSRLTHPASGLRLDYRRCMEYQVRHLAAVVQGRQEQYIPMVLK